MSNYDDFTKLEILIAEIRIDEKNRVVDFEDMRI